MFLIGKQIFRVDRKLNFSFFTQTRQDKYNNFKKKLLEINFVYLKIKKW